MSGANFNFSAGSGLISSVLGTQLPGPGTIYLAQDLHFRAPVGIGDTITARIVVRELPPVVEDVPRIGAHTPAEFERLIVRLFIGADDTAWVLDVQGTLHGYMAGARRCPPHTRAATRWARGARTQRYGVLPTPMAASTRRSKTAPRR